MINTYVQKAVSGHSIGEFMILPKYRRHGIGKAVAVQCFEKHKGDWEVEPIEGSERAYLFWKNVIDGYTDEKNQFEDGIFVFSN